ncbi:alpha/beta fold hydrolase [uncultured Roseobacter sp.]|uniref:alpha/beta fold hydrolase n=1 Tax=uncultured Roseobacter sp. TaxID=114847 RepID=UPI00262FC51A|nr:alpha/beta fold hydrolase [uncultured Roseobacter sp.]
MIKTALLKTVAVTAAVFAGTTGVVAQDLTARTAVLVHGAFADGSAWEGVIPYLEEAGLDVIAVQNPLVSLDGDVAFTQRAINRAEGPVVLVGHSWGGAGHHRGWCR